MGVERSVTTFPGAQPAIYKNMGKVLPGSFALKQTLPDDTLVPEGAPIAIDYSQAGKLEAALIKIGYVVAGGSTTKPHVQKTTLLQVGDVVMKLGKIDVAPTITAIDRSNASYDEITLSAEIAGLGAGDFLQEANAVSETTAEVKGVYTLTIGTVPAVDDKLTVNGIDYIFAAAAAEGKIAIGADKIATAANLQDTLEADNQNFVVKANGAKLVFTQRVAGVGAIPTIAVVQTGGGTLAASIATTTAGVAGVVGQATPKYQYPNAVTSENKVINSKQGFPDVAAFGEAWVLKGNVYPIPESWLTGYGLTLNQGIKYIKQ